MTSELKIMNRELLERLVQEHEEKNTPEQSKKTYLSQCKESLQKGDFENYCKHSGMAKEA
jgi:hypothetical protein